MFCPNCAAKIDLEQAFCRTCGLRLDTIFYVLAEQIPTEEHAKLQKRKELFEKLGLISLSVSGIIVVAFLFSIAVYYKMLLFGADTMLWSGFIAFMVFSLLSVFFFNYPKLFMNSEKVNLRLSKPKEKEISAPTNKLLSDNFIEPIPSVTENTTDLLEIKRKKNSGNL